MKLGEIDIISVPSVGDKLTLKDVNYTVALIHYVDIGTEMKPSISVVTMDEIQEYFSNIKFTPILNLIRQGHI